MKKTISIGIIGIFLLTGLATAFESSEIKTEIKDTQFSRNDEERFYDVRVFAFGRCNSIGSGYNNDSGQLWVGGLYTGNLDYAWASIYGGIEWMFTSLYNKSSTVRFLERTKFGVFCVNASGFFFWGSRGGYRPIPARIFIICHAELVSITQNWDD
jgi:hypothetical protein